jgi:hypothetical protein
MTSHGVFVIVGCLATVGVGFSLVAVGPGVQGGVIVTHVAVGWRVSVGVMVGVGIYVHVGMGVFVLVAVGGRGV